MVLRALSHSFGMNGYGQIWAVLIVTIIIRLIFMLITLPATISQQKMTYLQPEITKLQQKYPNSQTNQYEKQRFAQAQMALYKKNKIHPFMTIACYDCSIPIIYLCLERLNW
jgi:membrane protein insertase Oxa1/YidC/SpoIIIJ